MTPALELSVVSTHERLQELAPEWRALHDAHGFSVFQSYEWLATWWRHVGAAIPGAELHVVVLRDGARVKGIAPFFVQSARAFGMFPVRRLSFLGRETSDYLDVLVADDARDEVIHCLVDHFAENAHHFDVIALEDMSERSPNAGALLEEMRSRDMKVTALDGEPCPRTPLLATWEQTLESFPLQHRNEIRRRRSTLEQAAPIAIEIGGGPETIDADIAELVAMHQERSSVDGHTGALAVPHLRAFHGEAARLLAQRGAVFIAFLRVNGARLNGLYGLRHGDELAIHLAAARDPGELRRHSPGRVLAALCMEQAIRAGCTVFDFLRGTEEHKYELGARDVPNRTFIWYGVRAAFAEERHRFLLLDESLQRRAVREQRLWQHVSKKHGLVSKAAVNHIGDRFGAVLRDGIVRLSAPERSLGAKRSTSES